MNIQQGAFGCLCGYVLKREEGREGGRQRGGVEWGRWGFYV